MNINPGTEAVFLDMNALKNIYFRMFVLLSKFILERKLDYIQMQLFILNNSLSPHNAEVHTEVT